MSHAQEIRQVLRRLGNTGRKATPQSLPHPTESRRPPGPPARPSGQIKKRPRAETILAICKAWAEAARNHRTRVVATQLAGLCGSAGPHQLNRLHFAALTDRWQKEWSRATAYQYRRELAHLARFIGQQTGRPDLERDVPRVRRPAGRETIARPGEIERLKAVAKPWMRLFILIVECTALRRSDAMRLCAANISTDDTGRSFLTIRQKKTEHRIALPLADQLRDAIASLPPADDPQTPFLHRCAGKPVSKEMIAHQWTAIRKLAGVNPELTSHDLRRTVADALYDVSKDLRLVQQMLGHRTLASTLVYLEHKDPTRLSPILQQMWHPKGPVQ